MSNILVVGGAGYIGSHMCKVLGQNGHTPIVLDNLIYGHRNAVRWGPFVEGAVEDRSLLDRVFSEYAIDAVMHFAAYCYVGESVTEPAKYYRNNVANTLSLLEVMVEKNIDKFLFSSTCATYGKALSLPLTETHRQAPVNPYGRSKLMVEQILADYKAAYGMTYTALRYFNAAGADPAGEIGEDHRPETHLIPLVLKTALGQNETVRIFGDDYPTEDGTCVRDYIHVMDLAQAHLLALEQLLAGDPGDVYNLGNGNGYSVREIVRVARQVTGRPIPAVIAERRPGDPAVLIGSSDKAIDRLGWRPAFADLATIVETAWQWHQANPDGYDDR